MLCVILQNVGGVQDACSGVFWFLIFVRERGLGVVLLETPTWECDGWEAGPWRSEPAPRPDNRVDAREASRCWDGELLGAAPSQVQLEQWPVVGWRGSRRDARMQGPEKVWPTLGCGIV